MVRPPTPLSALVLATVLASGLGAAACGSKSQTATESPATTAGSTYDIVSDAAVAAGLTKVRNQAQQIKATLPTSQTEADAQTKTMQETWYTFEGTVRKNDKQLYLQMEDGLSAINSGVEKNDPAKVDKGIADLEGGASAYLAAHPG